MNIVKFNMHANGLDKVKIELIEQAEKHALAAIVECIQTLLFSFLLLLPFMLAVVDASSSPEIFLFCANAGALETTRPSI